MKKALSFALSVIMLLSVFTCLSVSVSAASPSDVMYVKSSGVSGDQVTYTIYLKKNVTLIGTILKVVYDPDVLSPVSGGAHSSSASAGLFVADKIKGVNNAYSLAFVSMDNYKVGSADKAFMTVTFKVIDKSYPVTNISFYCVEFSSSDANLKIEKNDTNPALLLKGSFSTLNKTNYVGAYSYEHGIRVEWKATAGATGYKVYKYNGSSYDLLGTTTKLSYDDPDVSANKSSTYLVRAYNASGTDTSSSSISGYYVKPTSKVAVSIQPNGVKVGWYLVDGATSYRIYRRVINPDGSRSGWTYLYEAGSTRTTYIDTKNLESGTHYEYTVRAYASTGASAVCRFADIWYLAAPTVKLSAVTGGVKVSWNAIEGAKKYNVYRMYNGGKTWTYIKTVTGLSFTDTAAISGRNIFYTVKAVGESGLSNYKSTKISYVGIPHLTSVANAKGGIQVKWNAVANATGYRVYRRAAGEKSWTYLTTVSTNSYFDKNVKAGVYYKYTVRTVFYSMFSNFESGLLVRYIPTPKLTSVANSGKNIVLKWQGSSVATEYRVYRRASGEKSWTYMGSVKSTQFTDTKVKSGVYYRYTVRAVNGYYSGFDGNGLLIKKS